LNTGPSDIKRTISTHSPEQEHWYLLVLLFTLVLLSSAFPILLNSTYRGSPDIHSTIEVCGSLLGIIAGIALVLRFYTLGNHFHLFVGLAFLINGSGDFVYGLMSFRNIFGMPASSMPQFIPGAYVAGRIMLGSLLILAPLVHRRWGESTNAKHETKMTTAIVFIITIVFTALTFYIPLPQFIYPEWAISRPVDFFSAVILTAALILFLHEYRRERDMLAWWISLSIGVNIVGQVMISYSKSLYDPFFDIGHLYKLLGYMIPLLGFSIYQISIIAERLRLLAVLDQQKGELQTSEERLRKIIEENADGIVVVNTESIVLFANPAAEIILGRKSEKLLGESFSLPADTGGKTEVEISLKDGLSRTAEIRAVDTDWEGKNARLVSLRDITQRKMAEKALRESEQLSHTIIETAADAFVEIDSCGLIIEWNRQAEDTFGWSSDEVRGHSLIEIIFPPEHRESHLENISNFLVTGENPYLSNEIELIAINRDGHEFPVELRIWPIKVDGSYRLNAFISDITDRKRLQQLKDEFVRTVSHELRTPLTTIKEGINQVLEGILGETTEGQKRFLGIVLKDINRLNRIINDLLDLSKMEEGKIELQKKLFDINSLADRVCETFQPMFKEKGLKIVTSYTNEKTEIFADEDRITRVITNLTGNAFKFTQQGQVQISVIDSGETVECSVSDTGKGIPGESPECSTSSSNSTMRAAWKKRVPVLVSLLRKA
jgi:PAS domain S-box-containing protein